MRVRLKGIHTVNKLLSDGSIREYRYAWRGGPRLICQPGTPEFIAEYTEAIKSSRMPPSDTVAGLVALYKASPAYIGLTAVTKRDYDPFLANITDEFGDMPVVALNEHGARTVFKEWRDRFVANPRKADRAWSVVRRVFSWAMDGELIQRNPCSGGGRLWNRSRADIIWDDMQVKLAKALISDRLWQALMLALWTGQRQGDLLALTWSAYDGSHIRLKQSKTGKRVSILVYSELKEILDNMDRQSVTILTNSLGRPWTSDGFKTSWGKGIKKAGISGVTFHDLRGTFITAARRNGATLEEIAAASGHALKDITRVLEAHYLAHDAATNDAVILKMERAKK